MSQTTGQLLWMLMTMVYLFFSGLQISYGYPKMVGGQFLTRHAHWFAGYVFLAYRSIPFLYELRVLLDWTCTKTVLVLAEVGGPREVVACCR